MTAKTKPATVAEVASRRGRLKFGYWMRLKPLDTLPMIGEAP